MPWDDKWFDENRKCAEQMVDDAYRMLAFADLLFAHLARYDPELGSRAQRWAHRLITDAEHMRYYIGIIRQREAVEQSRIARGKVELRERDRKRAFDRIQRMELFTRCGGECWICWEPLGNDWHADHIIPWAKGGPTTLENGMALCAPCNRGKRDTMPEGL